MIMCLLCEQMQHGIKGDKGDAGKPIEVRVQPEDADDAQPVVVEEAEELTRNVYKVGTLAFIKSDQSLVVRTKAGWRHVLVSIIIMFASLRRLIKSNRFAP